MKHNDIANPPLLLDKIETATQLGVSVRTLDRLLRDPDHPLPFVRVGRLVKFRPADVQSWIESQLTTGNGGAE